MARIYADELKATLSSNIFDLFSSEISESQRESEMITTFNEKSKMILTGNQYDHFRTQLVSFNDAMTKRGVLADKMGTSIKQAIQLLLDYMEGYAYLDTSKLDEYNRQKVNCINSINYLNTLLQQTNRNDYSVIQENISLATSTMTELDKIIKKVEGLDAVYAQAEQILASAFSGIDPFKTAVSSIKPDGTYSYRLV